MHTRVARTACALALVMALFSACATTRLTAVWKDQRYAGGPFSTIAVIALFERLSNRQTFETLLVERLRASGTGAVAGLDFMAPDQRYDYAALEKKFSALGVDGILIVRLTSVERKQVYVPGGDTVFPETRYDKYANYYYETYRQACDAGQVKETDIFIIESDLYANAGDRLVWRAETRSYEPGERAAEPMNAPAIASELGARIVQSLREHSLIAPASAKKSN